MSATKTPATTARPEDERLPLGATFMYGFQHVLTMYGGIVAVPLVVGQAAGMSADNIAVLIASCLFIGGLATVLQTIGVKFFGSQLPLVQGVSFAGVATMVAIVTTKGGEGGINAVYGAVLVASIIGLLIAPVFSMVIRFFPPVVTGTVITTIGLTLMPVCANWAMGGNSKAENYGSIGNIGLAGLTFLIVILLSKFGKGVVSRLSILLAMVIGTIIAVFTGQANFGNVGNGAIFAFPMPFHFGAPTFNAAAIISMFIVVLVMMTETSADIIAVGEVVGTKVGPRRVADGLRADMLSSAVAPIFNAFPQSAFAQNVGLVAITGVKSRFVVAAGGVIMLVLGLLPVLGRVVAAVPQPVLGGAGVVLFGTVAASGIRTLAAVNYKQNLNLIIVAASIGFGMIPIASPHFYDAFPDWFVTIFHSGISSSAIMAVLLNLLFNHIKYGKEDNASVIVAGTARLLTEKDLECLQDGDHFEEGRLIDKEGHEVPVQRSGGH